MATLLQRALVVVDCFSVVVRLDERLPDLARQRSVLRVALQRSLVNLDRLFRLKMTCRYIDIEAALKHIDVLQKFAQTNLLDGHVRFSKQLTRLRTRLLINKLPRTSIYVLVKLTVS